MAQNTCKFLDMFISVKQEPSVCTFSLLFSLFSFISESRTDRDNNSSGTIESPAGRDNSGKGLPNKLQ